MLERGRAEPRWFGRTCRAKLVDDGSRRAWPWERGKGVFKLENGWKATVGKGGSKVLSQKAPQRERAEPVEGRGVVPSSEFQGARREGRFSRNPGKSVEGSFGRQGEGRSPRWCSSVGS